MRGGKLGLQLTRGRGIRAGGRLLLPPRNGWADKAISAAAALWGLGWTCYLIRLSALQTSHL